MLFPCPASPQILPTLAYIRCWLAAAQTLHVQTSYNPGCMSHMQPTQLTPSPHDYPLTAQHSTPHPHHHPATHPRVTHQGHASSVGCPRLPWTSHVQVCTQQLSHVTPSGTYLAHTTLPQDTAYHSPNRLSPHIKGICRGWDATSTSKPVPAHPNMRRVQPIRQVPGPKQRSPPKRWQHALTTANRMAACHSPHSIL